MSILINGMEMPKGKPICIIIDQAGQVRRYDLNNDKYADDKLFEAVPVPPHGDLVDRDALMKELEIDDLDDRTGAALLMAVFLEVLKSAPTIIPAEPCNNLSKPCKDSNTFTSTATIPCDLSHPMSGYTSSSNYTEGKT